jgi:hypothetical protein
MIVRIILIIIADRTIKAERLRDSCLALDREIKSPVKICAMLVPDL